MIIRLHGFYLYLSIVFCCLSGCEYQFVHYFSVLTLGQEVTNNLQRRGERLKIKLKKQHKRSVIFFVFLVARGGDRRGKVLHPHICYPKSVSWIPPVLWWAFHCMPCKLGTSLAHATRQRGLGEENC